LIFGFETENFERSVLVFGFKTENFQAVGFQNRKFFGVRFSKPKKPTKPKIFPKTQKTLEDRIFFLDNFHIFFLVNVHFTDIDRMTESQLSISFNYFHVRSRIAINWPTLML